MKILTFNELTKYREKTIVATEKLILEAKEISMPTVFLSHSSNDKDELGSIIAFLKRYGAKVYIDKDDKELPPITNHKTAEILKERIEKIPKFVVYVTKNTKDSTWIPWELGIADGIRKFKNIALLPVAEYADDTEWFGQEYLGLYQKIIFGKIKGSQKEDWIVFNPEDNPGVYLNEWLKI